MKTKTLLTAALLIFVGTSVAFLIVKETGEKPDVGGGEPAPAHPSRSVEPGEDQLRVKTTEEGDDKVIVYYFHTTYRCWTCTPTFCSIAIMKPWNKSLPKQGWIPVQSAWTGIKTPSAL